MRKREISRTMPDIVAVFRVMCPECKKPHVIKLNRQQLKKAIKDIDKRAKREMKRQVKKN